MKLLVLLTILIFSQLALAAGESVQAFTYEGRLYDDNGNAVEDSSVRFRIQVFNAAKDCMIYEETQTKDMSSSNGIFALNIGTPTGDAKRSGNDPNFSMFQVFKNLGTLSGIPAAECAATNYTPAVGEKRVLRVHVKVGSGSEETLSPEMAINSVPSAVTAETLQGLDGDDFVKVTGSVTQVIMDDLAAGTSALYLKPGDNAQWGDGVNYTNNGQVGIGTSTPATDFEIQRASPTVRLESTATGGGDGIIEFLLGR